MIEPRALLPPLGTWMAVRYEQVLATRSGRFSTRVTVDGPYLGMKDGCIFVKGYAHTHKIRVELITHAAVLDKAQVSDLRRRIHQSEQASFEPGELSR